jgi:CPA1 family monovalent cation:H+ antiporter
MSRPVAMFESLIGLLFAAVILAAAARRIGAPFPSFLALGGAILAFVPGVPRFDLEPELALALFVAPVLLDAAYDTSVRELKDNWAPLLSLVLVAVGLTTVAVAYVAHALVPTMPWPAAVALGAVVAPPDAAAATTVLRQVKLPYRILTILEGESLLNDASALLTYRLAIGALLAKGFSAASVAPAFFLAVAGSIVVGPALAWLNLRLTEKIEDIPSAIIMQFIATFGVWSIAERIGLSGVLTMVCYAIAIARRAPDRTPARMRVPSYAVWDTAVFVLNVLAFVFIGLQVRPILEGLEPSERTRYVQVAGAVLLTVILVRFTWVMIYVSLLKLKIRWFGFHPPRPRPPPTLRGAVVVSWCGMRGIVTLAAALAFPTVVHGAAFHHRDLIVLTAFSVVLGTLVLQGLTLRPLLHLLNLQDDDPVGHEVDSARARALEAALATIEGNQSKAADVVREEIIALLENSTSSKYSRPSDASAKDEHRKRALVAARHAVSEMRANAEIGDDAFHRLEEELDRAEIGTIAR